MTVSAQARRSLRIAAAGVGYAGFLEIAVWLANHLAELPDRPMIWLDHHFTARGFRSGVELLARGDADLCLLNTRALAAQAIRGAGLFDAPLPALRAIAAFPHYDWSIFAVDQSLGVRSFTELRERKCPLRLATGYTDGDNIVGFLALQLLKLHGIEPDDLRTWGGEIIPTGLSNSFQLIESGQANAICQEGAFEKIVHDMFSRQRMVCLTVEPQAAHALQNDFGWTSLTVPADYYTGQAKAFVAPDFSAWLLCARQDLADDVAYAAAHIVIENGGELGADHLHRNPALILRKSLPPIRAEEVVNTTPVPLHPGSLRFYRERGLASRGD